MKDRGAYRLDNGTHRKLQERQIKITARVFLGNVLKLLQREGSEEPLDGMRIAKLFCYFSEQR